MQAIGQGGDCLFVYGTLMSRSRHPMALRLAAESANLGDATVCGRLYSLGAYPGIVPSRHRGDRVHGTVVKLRRPAHSLRWLDAYEGCGRDEPYGFQRVIARAHLMRGRQLDAWIYHYLGPLGSARRLRGGRFYPVKSLVRLGS